MISILYLHDINRELTAAPAAFAARADAEYEARLQRLAQDIYARREENPVILISGPSGSGKTTTALKLEKLLDSWGCETHTLSMDNYFHPFDEEQRQRAARGEIDLESPARVDADLLSRQLRDIIRRRPVRLPKYDFTTSQRVYPGAVLERRSGTWSSWRASTRSTRTLCRSRTNPAPGSTSACARAWSTAASSCTRPRSACCGAWCATGSTAAAAWRRRCASTTACSAARASTSCPTSTAPRTRSTPFFPYEIGAYRPLLLQEPGWAGPGGACADPGPFADPHKRRAPARGVCSPLVHDPRVHRQRAVCLLKEKRGKRR